jgi:hypothetical protein
VVFGWIGVPVELDPTEFHAKIRGSLFRSTDSVYYLEDKRMLALLMDDCRVLDAPRILDRISLKIGIPFQYGLVGAPDDGTNAELLVLMAERKFKNNA